MRRVKLHGAFRSGTNYAKAILELNYQVELASNLEGWKHAPVPPGEIPVVGVVKDPYAWLVSFWRYSRDVGSAHVKGGRDWRAFLVDPVTVTHGHDPKIPEYRFANPVDYWNAMAANLTSLGDRCAIVRYEDALTDAEAIAKNVASQFNLERVTDVFQEVEYRTRNMVDRSRTSMNDYVTDEEFDASWYLERKFLGEFDRHDRQVVRSQLDLGLTGLLGY